MAAKRATKPPQNTGDNTGASNLAEPWKPGQSGNPGGRPKTKFITDALKKAVNPEELVEGLIRLALKAKEPAIRLAATKYIMDRIEGTPLHRSEVTIDDVRETARRMAREQGEDEEAAVREAEAIFRGERVS
jgi:hypothetical protein